MWDHKGNMFPMESYIYKDNSSLILQKNLLLPDNSENYYYTDFELSYLLEQGSTSLINLSQSNSFGSITNWNNVRQFNEVESPNILRTFVRYGLTRMEYSYFSARLNHSTSPTLGQNYFTFNTNGLYNIKSAKIKFKPSIIHSSSTENVDYKSVILTEGQRSNPSTVTIDDWNRNGGLNNVLNLSSPHHYDNFVLNEFNSIELNESGINHINESGISDFALRDSRDINDIYSPEPTNFDRIIGYSVLAADTNNRSYLEVIQNNSEINQLNSVKLDSIKKNK